MRALWSRYEKEDEKKKLATTVTVPGYLEKKTHGPSGTILLRGRKKKERWGEMHCIRRRR